MPAGLFFTSQLRFHNLIHQHSAYGYRRVMLCDSSAFDALKLCNHTFHKFPIVRTREKHFENTWKLLLPIRKAGRYLRGRFTG